MTRAHQHPAGLRQALAGQRKKALGVRADQVLERAAMDLHRVRHASPEGPGQDHRARHEVVRQRNVGRGAIHHGPDGRHVGVEIVAELVVR